MAEQETAPEGALAGISVLEAGLLVQGPQATALLAQLGASVTKIELPGLGDQSRWLPVAPDDPRSAYFAGCNRGKRSVTLDLRRPAGQEVFRRLASTADVVVTNFLPGTMERWGLGYDELRAANPGLVFAAGSAFGPEGPDADRAGADLSAQASGGLISGIGADGSQPSPVPVTVADHIGSLNLVSGILAALMARHRTGRGQKVEVSLLGSQIWAQASEYTSYLMTGRVPGRANRSHPLIPGIYGIFPTADGWLAVVGVTLADRARFFAAIGREALAEDGRFMAPLVDAATKEVLFPLLDQAFAERTTAEWCDILRAAAIRYAPVRDYAQVAEDPQVWRNGYLARDRVTTEGDDRIVGTPIGLSETPASAGDRPPELGEHTEAVLLESGLTWDDIERLRSDDAI